MIKNLVYEKDGMSLYTFYSSWRNSVSANSTCSDLFESQLKVSHRHLSLRYLYSFHMCLWHKLGSNFLGPAAFLVIVRNV